MPFKSKLAYETVKHLCGFLPDRKYLQLLYLFKMGRRLDLDNPRTFNEKMQWLKLYDRNPLCHKLVDKVAVKDYVAASLGTDKILRTYGVWDRAQDIQWDTLPKKFVLKLTAGGGGRSICICRDKSAFDRKSAVRRLMKDHGRNLYRMFREWVYKDVPQRIIAEELLETADGSAPSDYKFWCFWGKVECIMVCLNRNEKGRTSFNYFDAEWNHLPFWKKYPSSNAPIPRPEGLEEMLSAAGKLSKGFPFVRVDLYHENGRMYFGELTFYAGSGLSEFHPEEWDVRLGNLLQLPREAHGQYVYPHFPKDLPEFRRRPLPRPYPPHRAPNL